MNFEFALQTLKHLTIEEKLPLLALGVEFLMMNDLAFMKKYPDTPPLYKSGITYELMPRCWRDTPTLLVEKKGDCKSLVAYRLAELRAKGEKARAHFVVQKRGENILYHIEVKRESGVIEDPSKRLGMLLTSAGSNSAFLRNE